MTIDPTVRIAPLDIEELSEVQKDLLIPTQSGRTRSGEHLFRTLVRHPGLFRKWSPFGGKLLLAGKLPARDREILILRTAWRCQVAYEWGHHVFLGREAGLSDREIEQVKGNPDDPGWSGHEAALVRAVDEMHDGSKITDATWAYLAMTYDDPQLIEVPMVVGHYTLLSYVINSLGIRLEPGFPGLD
jgi:4-carboxymuconolactone decarboxylase